MTIDLQDLIRKAIAATQGDWTQSAAHIAVNSPDVTRTLVRRIRELESALDMALYRAEDATALLESKGHSMAPHHERQMERLRAILKEGLVDL